MASKKEKSPAASQAQAQAQDEDKGAAAAKGSAKKGTPSVASFLSKISTPKGQGGAASPAKGLLGGVTRDGAGAHDLALRVHPGGVAVGAA